MTAPVLFSELACPQGGAIAVATLNNEKTLNALNLPMIELLYTQLQQWQSDTHIKMVFLQGQGEKAFCAGGDVLAARQSSLQTPGGPCEYAETLFELEYRLDYLLHNYRKPMVVWGHGIVMGGGLGLLAGCSHRVVSEKTRIAMPEVTIALFPDVGGSYFLNRMPGACGRFLALTAASINATDALYAGLADTFINHSLQAQVLECLQGLHFSGDKQADSELINAQLSAFAQASAADQPAPNLQPHQAIIDQLCEGDDVQLIAERIEAYQSDDEWLQRAQQGLRGGSPLAIKWIFKQLQISRELDLKAVFNAELVLVTNIMRHPEFAEGVRALLVDKDKNPQWQYKTLAEVDDAVVDSFFEPPWPQNPLVDL
ncbi:enoyl-CoA hydratase/isomerase family protein [Dasania sp. GY-MA-18]|uniref:3-hydroxyisobutyryl-CoA hydrolase n=1 Tax=Dasania phycosphaerae TaxID=2950436 RepID=A0A9J6RHP0_9GAMM|nr:MULTISPECIES: enoyl-CoA hydratase/isomerase family protein [Dasania]MCR8921543.1 enoyl-CoA hydratase/isomerase family protein [Dasania sp. GY-MA-18]MCZ0863971.1 enoyl-CoA hydratase/isomerase family protein [Dasania phycosphaerae]MCZ0867699.1 enoyl-CoA hydratase/isomerase family protein [Dasania phycosphaerae]